MEITNEGSRFPIKNGEVWEVEFFFTDTWTIGEKREENLVPNGRKEESQL